MHQCARNQKATCMTEEVLENAWFNGYYDLDLLSRVMINGPEERSFQAAYARQVSKT